MVPPQSPPSDFDGRVASVAGINTSADAGDHWTHPPSVTPPARLCSADRRAEPSAFGISVDRTNPRNVYIGTNCGLAISNDRGVTWKFVDPTPNDPALNVWDVVVHHGGMIDVCGDDGHLRSIDGGVTWTSGTGLPSGVCSIAVAPSDSNALFVAVGANAYESDNGGTSWTNLGTPDSRRQGRIPFVATNPRSQAAFDLWYGDVHLYRGSCALGAGLHCPMAATGAPSSSPPTGWSGPFTRGAGGHDDAGDVAFDSRAASNACPLLFSSDGGVYYNTKTTDPDCQSPLWEQPDVTPHGLWAFAMDGAHRSGVPNEDLYFGNQDDGVFATTDAGAPGPGPTWKNTSCCDGFDFAADPTRVVYTVCCGLGVYVDVPGLGSAAGIATNPPGNIPTFNFPDFIARFGDNQYVAATDSGAFITTSINASSVVWTMLGAASTPRGGFCAVKVGLSGGTPTFYAQTRCLGGQLWKYVGTAPAGTWQRVDNNSGLTGGFGVYAVDLKNPNRLYASNLSATGPRMVFSTDGGANWNGDPGLDNLMTGSGAFKYQTARGPTSFTGFWGYPQPSLVAFDPGDANILVAGGIDSGVFLSTDAGASWRLVDDPFDSGNSGTPHIPRPWFAYFDYDAPGGVNVYLGTQGRGVWRIGFQRPQPRFEYAAKVVCGIQKDPQDMRLARGFYATTVNIHNPNQEVAEFFKKLALTFPPSEQAPGKVIRIADDRLGPDQALKVDCMDLRRRLFPKGLPAPYIEGFVVIESGLSLDVTAVYTTAALDARGAVTLHSSIDVEQIRERQIKEEQPPQLPDLTVRSIDTVTVSCPGGAGTCITTVRFTIANVGSGNAGPFNVRIACDPAQSVVVNQPVTGLAAGGVLTFTIHTPPGRNCFDPDCTVCVTVDSNNDVVESNETNNSLCQTIPG